MLRFCAPGVRLSVLLSLLISSSVYALEPDIAVEAGRETVARQEMEVKADQYFKNASVAFSKASYQEAVDNYLKSIECLKKCSGSSEYVKKKLETTNEALSKAYFHWSETVAVEAEKAARAQDYDKAVSLAQEASSIYPLSKTKMDAAIERYKKMKEVVGYRSDKSEKKTDPDKSERLYNIDVLMRQGIAFYNDKQLDKAKEKFEDVLVIDPYQMKAIDYLRKINIKMQEVGKQRTITTRDERLAEVEWKYVSPVMPKTLSGETESVTAPVAKMESYDKIQKKLDSIVLDNLDFDETTVPTVIKYLRKRSKDLDPEHEGINIFLRLPAGASAKAPAEGDDAGGGAGAEASSSASSDAGLITMSVPSVSLREAITLICRQAHLQFRIEKYAVVIAPKNVALDELETQTYPLDKEAIEGIGLSSSDSIKKHFENRGIEFPTGAKVVYESRIGRLIVTNTRENIKKMEEIIHNELTATDPQVLVQTKFVEVSQNDLNELGFTYETALNNGSHVSWGANDQIVRTLSSNGIGTATATQYDTMIDATHSYTKNGGTSYWNVVVHALDQVDSSDTLSTPRVTTVNGQEASIRMVTLAYYPTSWNDATISTVSSSSTTSGSTSASQQLFVASTPVFGDPTEEGIIMVVKPMVDADRYTINLEMNPQIQEKIGWTDYSYDITSNGLTYPNTIKMPIIDCRSIETAVSVYDGETIVLGGIIKDRVDTIDDKYPLIGDLPLVGRLFQSKAQQSTKTNLLIFLTCRLVNPDGSPIRAREQRGLPPFTR